MTENNSPLIDFERDNTKPIAKTLLKFFKKPINKLLSIDQLNEIYDKKIKNTNQQNIFSNCLKAFDISSKVHANDLSRIPEQGSLVVISNHPFGGVDGIMLMDMMKQKRNDVKILANNILDAVPEMKEHIIAVDIFSSNNQARNNARALKQAIRHVREGGALVIFPAGAVSYFQLTKMRVADPQWSEHIAALIKMSQATVLPIYIQGRNSFLYQIIGLWSPILRSLMLVREIINKQSQTFKIHIGQNISSTQLKDFKNKKSLINFLRQSIEFLKNRKKTEHNTEIIHHSKIKKNQKIIAPINAGIMEHEINLLPKKQQLINRNEFSVYIASATEIPHTLREIGRLRELTFRDVGEGTGNCVDIDDYDQHYLHLFVWNHQSREVVGAYRLGLVDDILQSKGREGLYTITLFKMKSKFISNINDSIELGRSFIRPKYQESFAVLPMLWKGICIFMNQHPQYRKLFGPVSISQEYKIPSKGLMVNYLKNHNLDPYLSRYVRARNPFRIKKKQARKRSLKDDCLRSMEDVSFFVSGLEEDGKGIPVLLKHYLKLEAKLLSFHVDPHFQNSLDGLILVDFDNTNERTIRHYMGKEEYDSFKSFKQYKMAI